MKNSEVHLLLESSNKNKIKLSLAWQVSSVMIFGLLAEVQRKIT